MATIGISKPYYAKYLCNNGVVSYEGGGVMGKLTEAGVNITSNSSNLYADNAITESDRSFASGDLTLKTDDLSQDVSKNILGATENALEAMTGVSDASVKELIFGSNDSVPDLGVGFIIKKKVAGAYKYRGIVLPRVMFSIPSDAATTQGESIEWQVPELSGTIKRCEDANGTWKREATFSTEAQAEAYIKTRLGLQAAAPSGQQEGE